MKPLEIQEWLEQPLTRWIPVDHRHDVRQETSTYSRVAGECLGKHIGDEKGRNNLIAKPRRDPVKDRILEARTV
jgi:hypothetical protein